MTSLTDVISTDILEHQEFDHPKKDREIDHPNKEVEIGQAKSLLSPQILSETSDASHIRQLLERNLLELPGESDSKLFNTDSLSVFLRAVNFQDLPEESQIKEGPSSSDSVCTGREK